MSSYISLRLFLREIKFPQFASLLKQTGVNFFGFGDI